MKWAKSAKHISLLKILAEWLLKAGWNSWREEGHVTGPKAGLLMLGRERARRRGRHELRALVVVLLRRQVG